MLEWAAGERRLLLTHDGRTMVGHAYERIRRGQFMPGLIKVTRGYPMRELVEGILLIADGLSAKECENQIFYVP